MTLASVAQSSSAPLGSRDNQEYRAVFRRDNPSGLTGIYREQTNIAIWDRRLSDSIKCSAKALLDSGRTLEIARTVTPESAEVCVSESLPIDDAADLILDVVRLVDMFCCLFGRSKAGLRLTTLRHAMCPRFHVDNVPCRLVTTYQGAATQWLPHACVNRSRLGPGSQGKPDGESGLYHDASDIQELSPGDVALLKGECWEGNENAGLVHRSPGVIAGQSRLLLTLDMMY